ncbi:hypothetical protein [Amycolatopsis jiangsuensis]|uniref:Anti-sigma-K factor RskA n=1 Tax=Amycolatopsis jiangsuensis TaxID=1181879 RepID=A0A840J1J2_9PSEU|nr:hypothetical protein [Amycolatopsis jiangsuensis]MBB4687258.1 anti-sigma-K factor RskA [Amycolatopsis jiangsuensis]
MTDESRGAGGSVGPPWSVDLLADLHAGVLAEDEAARLWPQVEADPEARTIIEALEATTADLSALAGAPAPPMPAEYAARLDAALAAESAARQPAASTVVADPVATSPAGAVPSSADATSSQLAAAPPSADATSSQAGAVPSQAGATPFQTGAASSTSGAASSTSGATSSAPVADLSAARRRRNRRLGWAGGVLTAAAAAVVALAVTVPGTSTESGTPNVAAPAPTGPSVSGDGGGAEALIGGSVGVRDFGPLRDERRLDVCVAAAGMDPKVRPEGIRPVNVAGKAGVLVIYTTGRLAEFRLVAFGADCGPADPAKLFDKVVGGR